MTSIRGSVYKNKTHFRRGILVVASIRIFLWLICLVECIRDGGTFANDGTSHSEMHLRKKV